MENELVVRLVECAKPLNSVYDSNDPTQVLITGWADTTTVPKRGEICLEYYTNTDSSSENYGKICYRMKIGDGIHKYIESNPDDSLPYFPLSDDVINLIVSWVNTHLNVNEYAQASYDNTNHTLKVYSISEQYGKIGHLADGTATPSLDVEVTFAAGTKINLASVDNTLTITHEATTRSDTNNTTDITAATNVVTGVTTDATGHITGITTYNFPAYTTIAPIQSVASGNHITVSTSNNTATVNHDAVGTGTAISPTSGTAPDWGGDVLTGVSIDSYGHVAGATKGALPSNPVSAASGTTNQIMVSNGDNTTSTSGKTITTTAPSSTSNDTTVPTSKAVDTAITTAVNALDGSVYADTNKVLTGVTEVDGVITNKTDVAYTTIAPVQSVAGDNTWTSASTSNNTVTVSHIGPDTSSTSSATATAGTAPGFGGNVLTGVTIDGKGHVTGVTTGALPSNPVSGLEGSATDTDSGISVQVDTSGGQVSAVDVTVDTSTLATALGLSGAMHFIGSSSTPITDGGTEDPTIEGYTGTAKTPGNVVLYSSQEFVWTGTAWELLGDEGSYALKTVEITGTGALGGGGTLEANRTITHNTVTQTTSTTTLSHGGTFTAVTDRDSYGHSANIATYTLPAGPNDGTFTVKSDNTDTNTVIDVSATSADTSSNTTITFKEGNKIDLEANATNKTITIKHEDVVAHADTDTSLPATVSDRTYIKQIYRDAQGHITGINTGSETVTDTNTWRNVQVNGTEKLGNGIDTGALNVKDGTRTKVEYNNGLKINHAKNIVNDSEVNPAVTDNTGSANIGERETEVITNMTVDDYGHITAYTKDKSTNLIAADIKAPVKRQDDSIWNYRETGGDITIGEDTAKIPSLKGNTLVWNQLFSNPSQTLTCATIFTVYEGYYGNLVGNYSVPSVKGVYYISFDLVGEVSSTLVRTYIVFLNDSGSYAEPVFTRNGNHFTLLYKGTPYGVGQLFIRIVDRTQNTGYTGTNVQYINLSKLFGSDFNIEKSLLGLTTEVAWDNLTADQLALAATNFEKLFPNSYYPYCEGRLVNLGGYHVKLNQYGVTPIRVSNRSSSNEEDKGTFIRFTKNNTDTTLVSWNYKSPDDTYHVFPVGHKIYMKIKYRSNEVFYFEKLGTSTPLGDIGATSGSEWGDASIIIDATLSSEDSWGYGVILARSTTHVLDIDKKTEIIDLTAMFGPGSEPTLEEFEAMFPNDYYEYDEGTEMNIFDAIGDKELGLESTGFNLWDGGDLSNFINFRWDNILKYKGQIYVQADLVQSSESGYFRFVFHYTDGTTSTSTLVQGTNIHIEGLSTTNKVVEYISATYSTGSASASNICINLSSSRNGEYEPYKKDTLDLDWIREIEYTPEGSSTPEKLFPYGLLSAGSVHDEVTETKAVKRVGVVDLGSLTWTKDTSGSGTNLTYVMYAILPNGCFVAYNSSKRANLICSKYSPTDTFTKYFNSTLPTNNLMVLSINDPYVVIRDDNFINSTASDYQTAMQGVMLYYELATPIEIPLTEPHQMSYVVDDHGTEQQLPINVSSVINAPFVGTFEYYSNFKEGVLDLMGRFNDFTPTTEIIPDSNSTLPTSQAVIDYMRAGGNGVKPVYESGNEVIPTTDVHAGLKTEVGNNSYKYYKVPFSAVTNDPSTGTSQVQIILNGNFS